MTVNKLVMFDFVTCTVGLCLCTQTHYKLVWIIFPRNILLPSSEILLKTQTVNSSETLLPRLHVVQT